MPSSANNLLLCLATKKGYRALESLLAAGDVAGCLHVCTFLEQGVAESYTAPIRDLAKAANLPLVRWKDFRADPKEFLQARGIRGMVCIGWRYLAPPAAVEYLQGEVIIAHDSLLPKLRGFAPLPTAIITGEPETGVTFLHVGPSVDDGEILWQGRTPIAADDTIAVLIDKITPHYVDGLQRYVRGELTRGVPQNEAEATYSIWRDTEDYRIDWRDDAARIERSVRALGSPYLGAQTLLGDRLVTVESAAVCQDVPFAIRQPGKIWRLSDGGCPEVVCGQGMLRITRARGGETSLLPVTSLRQRFK